MPFGRINGGKPRSLAQSSTAAIVRGAAVKISGSGTCVVSTGSAVGNCGLALFDGENVVGKPVSVVSDGLMDGNAGGTITAGDPLIPTTAGALVTATGTGLRYILGYAEEDAVSGDVFSVRVNPSSVYIP